MAADSFFPLSTIDADLTTGQADTTGKPVHLLAQHPMVQTRLGTSYGTHVRTLFRACFNRLARLQTDSRTTDIEPGTGIPLRVANTGPTMIVKPTHHDRLDWAKTKNAHATSTEHLQRDASVRLRQLPTQRYTGQ